MKFSIVINLVKGSKRSFIFWGAGFLILSLYLTFLYPTIKASTPDLTKILDNFPPALKATVLSGSSNFSTLADFLNVELFNFMLPLLFLFYAINFGSGAIAGEEEKGTLDLILANPISRAQVVIEKFLSLVLQTLILSLLLFIVLVFSVFLSHLQIDLVKLLEAVSSVFFLAVTFGSFALFLGAAFGKKALSIGLTAFAAVISYFINTLGALVKNLESLRKFTPFFHYNNHAPIVQGLNLSDCLFFIVISLACLALAIGFFNRRDLNT